MKILFLSSYVGSHVASSHLASSRNVAFAKQGWDMVFYAPTPSRGLTKEEIKKSRKNRTKYNIEKRQVIHLFRMFREGNNTILRAFRYTLSAIKEFNRGVFAKDARSCNVMLISSTPPIQGAMAAMVKKCRRDHIPFIYVLQDIFPDSLVGTGMTHKGSLLWKIGRRIENFTYRNADKIIVISQDFKRNIMAKGVPEEKIEVIYNWVDQNAVVDVPREQNKLFAKYNLDPSKFYITYSGNIGLTQNMDMLLAVMEELKTEEPDVQLVLIGEGAYKAQVEKIVAEKNLSNVAMLPFQPYEDIGHVFSLGDAGLVISKPGVGENSVPSKTWSIMSASRPVLANFDENELKEIVNGESALRQAQGPQAQGPQTKKPCGIFTKAGDKEAFKEAILTLFNNRELCNEYGRNGRQFVMDNLTKEVGTQKYVNVIKSVVKQ